MADPHGNALRIEIALANLARRHNVTWPLPAPPVAPLPACDDYSVHMAGLASDSTIDNARLRFAPHALLWHAHHLPELRYRHQPGAIGRVLELHERSDGLHACLSTTDRRAMTCAGLSIGATILEWHVVDANTPDFHVVVASAWADEISLVHEPCNPRCLINRRTAGSPHAQVFDLAARGLELIRRLVVQLQSPTAKDNSHVRQVQQA
jgi:hypothetical protein